MYIYIYIVLYYITFMYQKKSLLYVCRNTYHKINKVRHYFFIFSEMISSIIIRNKIIQTCNTIRSKTKEESILRNFPLKDIIELFNKGYARKTNNSFP